MKNTKRFMALLLALVLVFSSMTTAFAEVNEDVMDTEFEVAVGKLNAVGIMEGYPDGTFRPEGNITRAEFAKIAVLSLGLNDAAEVSRSNTIFTDVDAMHWAAGYINVAVDRGILKGYPDGTYKPSNSLTNAEAVTILTRLVGLGPVVDKDGNWPANYITQANILGVMKGVAVSSTTNATRGNAAKMLVNTLTVQKWGATGYNNDGSVQYGEMEFTNGLAKTLLNDNLNISIWDAVVTDYFVDDNALEVDLFDEDGNYDSTEEFDVVAASVDLYEMYLNDVEIWVNSDDEIIFGEITSTFYLDGVTYDVSDEEFDLEVLDKSFKAVKSGGSVDTDLYVYGDSASIPASDTSYELAKVVLNGKREVVRVDAYIFDAMTVVEDVEDDVVIGIDEEEVDLEDYTIFKDGKLISTDDLKKGDILAYNVNEDFAEVYNNSVTGEISNVFNTTFDIDDEEYEYMGTTLASAAQFLKDGDLVNFNKDLAEDLEDADEAVTIFFDRLGEVVYVTGELGDAGTNTVGAYLLEDPKFDDSFGRIYVELIFVNEAGTKVTETVRLSDIDKIDGADYTAATIIGVGGATPTGAHADIPSVQGDVIEVVYDDDGDVVELNLLSAPGTVTAANKIEPEDKFVDGQRLLSGTVIFSIDDATLITDDDGDVSTLEYSDLEFDIDSAEYYVVDNEVLYIVTNSEPTGDDTLAYVDASSVRLSGSDVTRLTAWVDGVKTTYSVDKVNIAIAADGAYTLEIKEDSSLVIDITAEAMQTVTVTTGGAIDISAGEIVTTGGTLKVTADTSILLNDGGDISSIRVRNIEEGDSLRIVRVSAGSAYVDLLVVIR
jgi:hypothetical protein